MGKVAFVHDSAPFWHRLGPNSFWNFGNHLTAVHRPFLLLKLGDHIWLVRQILNDNLIANIGNYSDHYIVKPRPNIRITLVQKRRANCKIWMRFYQIILHFFRRGPAGAVADLRHAVVICNIACVIAWLVGENSISTNRNIWPIVELFVWNEIASKPGTSLSPCIRSTQIVFISRTRFPIVCNTFPCCNLR